MFTPGSEALDCLQQLGPVRRELGLGPEAPARGQYPCQVSGPQPLDGSTRNRLGYRHASGREADLHVVENDQHDSAIVRLIVRRESRP